LVDPAPGLQDRREERPLGQLRDLDVEVAGLGRQHPVPVTVAFRHPPLRALVAAGPDRSGGLGLDQLLERPTRQLADQIDALADL
jgi:hypothetical protein